MHFMDRQNHIGRFTHSKQWDHIKAPSWKGSVLLCGYIGHCTPNNVAMVTTCEGAVYGQQRRRTVPRDHDEVERHLATIFERRYQYN